MQLITTYPRLGSKISLHNFKKLAKRRLTRRDDNTTRLREVRSKTEDDNVRSPWRCYGVWLAAGHEMNGAGASLTVRVTSQ